jgi:hypothetical protein
MSQPPSDQDRPSIWPSGDEPPAWPPVGQEPPRPSGNQAPRGSSGKPRGSSGKPPGSSGNEPPAWPSGPSQGQQPSWPSGDQPPAWPSAGQGQAPTWSSAGQGQPSAWPSSGQGQSPPAWAPEGQPPLSSPDATYGYSRRPARFRRRFPIRAVIVLALFIAFGFAVRGLTSHHKAPTITPPLHTGLQAPAGTVGASFSLDDGSGARYQVTLIKVIDPARGASQASPPGSGKRFVGLVFRIKGTSGTLQDEDADKDAVLVGANGQDYASDLKGFAGYGHFDDGVIHLSAGQTTTGAVAFQVPDGVTVSTVQWTALSGFGPMVEWTVQS